jgi:hypothetical protein
MENKSDEVAPSSIPPSGGPPKTSESSIPPNPGIRRHRSRPRRGSSFRGKLSLVAIFLILRALDAFIFFEYPLISKSALVGALINNIIWTTALLTAIWLRKSWARYVLIFFQALGALSDFILLPDFWIKFDADNRLIIILSTTLIVHAAIAWFLLFSRDLDRLTGRGKA